MLDSRRSLFLKHFKLNAVIKIVLNNTFSKRKTSIFLFLTTYVFVTSVCTTVLNKTFTHSVSQPSSNILNLIGFRHYAICIIQMIYKIRTYFREIPLFVILYVLLVSTLRE